MTKRILKLGAISLGVIVLTLGVMAMALPSEQKEPTLGSLVDQMDNLRDLKQECSDNLNTIDTAHFLRSEPGYCDSWDNEIIEIRNQINELQKKDYERARELGLN